MMEKIRLAADYIKRSCVSVPSVGIVLGSGLGNFINEINVTAEIAYSDIPGFPVSTVAGHSGKLVIGSLGGKEVVAMAGRFHPYEGYAASDIVFPVRVLKMMGVTHLLLSNAAGGVNPNFRIGDLMLIKDHISQFIANPLTGPNPEELGPRFPDMSEPYDNSLIIKAKGIAATHGIDLKEGVYVCVEGPTYETHAEYKMIEIIGGDAVGMSTVQEVIAAVHAGMKCFAVSVITDLGIRDQVTTITHEEVLAAAKNAEPKLSLIFRQLVSQI